MKSKLLSFVLTALIILGLLTSCGILNPNNTPSTSVGTADTSSPDVTTLPGDTSSVNGTTAKGESTTAIPPVTTAAEDLPDTPSDLAAGTLIFSQNFDSLAPNSDSASTVAALGWTLQTTFNGAYSNNTSKYSIVRHNGSNQLFVNNLNGGKDSYVKILNDTQMGFFHEGNYTVQYDLEYTEAGNAARYIALVTDYNG